MYCAIANYSKCVRTEAVAHFTIRLGIKKATELRFNM